MKYMEYVHTFYTNNIPWASNLRTYFTANRVFVPGI